MIKKLKIHGFRGFAEEQTLDIAIPNGKRGSGLTVIVGPNNSGKSTIIEAFLKMNANNPTFSQGKRNISAGDIVTISIVLDNDSICTLRTIGSQAAHTKWDPRNPNLQIYILTSRRAFNPFFGNGRNQRREFSKNYGDPKFRSNAQGGFSNRLIDIENNPSKKLEFNKLFQKISGMELDWTIDLDDSGQYYIRIKKDDNTFHNSDGLGEGLISLLYLVDGIFEFQINEVLVIDEPELSLHPQIQRRYLEELLETARDKQIIYATHSPEMVSIEALLNGGELSRIVSTDSRSEIYRLNDDARSSIKKLSGDVNNPHTLGYEARSCFFEEDNLVVVEGQEDVIFLRLALEQLNISKNINFFGFGAGGSSKIEQILTILDSLGFRNVCCLYDGDKQDEMEKAKEKFGDYAFKLLNADDIREKEERIIKAKDGIFSSKKINEVHQEGFEKILNEIAEEFGREY